MFRRIPAALLGILGIQQALLWAILLSNSPLSIVTWDAVSGAMGAEILRGFTFSWLDTWDGILGGMFLGALWGSPWFLALGVHGTTVKLAATTWSALTTILGWFLGGRLGGRAGAVALALLFALPPPVTVLSSLVLGHWHHAAIVFDTALALLVMTHVWNRRGKTPGWVGAGAAGFLAGVSLFQCFGSLIQVVPLTFLGWALLRRSWGGARIAVAAAGLLLGLAPMVWKLTLHAPYGVQLAEGHEKVPPELVAVSLNLGKLTQLLPGGGFAWGLHYQDAWDVPRGTIAQTSAAEFVTVGLFAGWLLLLLRVGPTLIRITRAALPGSPSPPLEGLSPRAVPAALGVSYLLAFLLSDMSLRPLPWWLTNVRELGHILILPWLPWLMASLVALVASFREELVSGRTPPGEWSPAPASLRTLVRGGSFVVVAIVLLDAASMVATVRPAYTLPGFQLGVRTPAWDVFGFFPAPAVGLDMGLSERLCARYGVAEQVECWRGAAWALGFAAAEDDGGEGLRDGCSGLAPPWRQECLRGMGWSFKSQGAGGLARERDLSARCEHLEEEQDRASCWRGVGFPLGDHLNSVPARLMRALQEVPPHRRALVAQGAAALIGRSNRSRLLMDRMCQEWDEDLQDDCQLGIEDSLRFRGPAVTEPSPSPDLPR